MDVKYLKSVSFYVIFLLIWFSSAYCFSTIKFLPGFSAQLPFKLETGYIEVRDGEIFYFFVESERNPAEDPLILWINGGPGCSGFSGFFLQFGPLYFNMVEYNGSLPTLALNPYSWTRVANIIFIDAPVGTGFSYSRTSDGWKTGDKTHANDCYNFLRKWLQSHPKFIKNPLYVSGDSYGGLIAPLVTEAIADGIENKIAPEMNLKGYSIGNGLTDRKIDPNSRIPYYNRMALISDELYESVKRNCKEEYLDVDVGNQECGKDLQTISELTARINTFHILDPFCDRLDGSRKSLLEASDDILHQAAQVPQFGCRSYNTYLLNIWVLDINVQEAIHVRKGTIKKWIRCNRSIDYDRDVQSALSSHVNLNTRGYRALIHSGDHDPCIPYVGTEAWIKSLNFSIVENWRPWMVDGQVAGYSTVFQNDFSFATVKGGGHTGAEYNPKECFAMLKRWLSHEPL